MTIGLHPKSPIWNLTPARVDRRYRQLWHGAKGIFPLWESIGGNDETPVYVYPSRHRWKLDRGAISRTGGLGREIYFPGGGANEVRQSGHPGLEFATGEHYTFHLVLKIHSFSNQRQGIFRDGAQLWIIDDNNVWSRHNGSNAVGSNTVQLENEGFAGKWISLTLSWDGRTVRLYLNGALRDEVVNTGAPSAWTFTHFGWQFTGSDELIDTSVAFFGVWGRGVLPGEVAQLACDPFGMIRMESVARLLPGGDEPEPPPVGRRPVVMTICS